MQVADKVVVVTGGANGIGKALCERFHKEGASLVVVADLEEAPARLVADAIGGEAFGVNVRDEGQIQAMVADVESRHGPIDLFCSNAGIIALDGEHFFGQQIWWAWIGLVPLITGIAGFCPCYTLVRFSTSSPEENP